MGKTIGIDLGTTNSCIAVIEGGEPNPENGLYYANESAIHAALRLYPEVYPRIVDHIMQLGGGGYVSLPQEATLEMAEIAIDRYYQGATQEAKDKVEKMGIALSAVGTRGDVQPMTALGLALRARGHDVRLCAPPDFHDSTIDAGLPFFPVGQDIHEMVTVTCRDMVRKPFAPLRVMGRRDMHVVLHSPQSTQASAERRTLTGDIHEKRPRSAP